VPPAPLPPLKIQLLAILKENGVFKAAVYDPDTDKILVVAAGEKIGSRTVDSIAGSGITLKDGQGVRTLALKDQKGTELKMTDPKSADGKGETP
jgi:hypothetical protein